MNKDIEKQLLKMLEEDELDEFIVEEGDWISGGKYQHIDTIVAYQDKWYKITQSRSGSYHTDWDYLDPYVCEVKPVEVITTKWKEVK